MNLRVFLFAILLISGAYSSALQASQDLCRPGFANLTYGERFKKIYLSEPDEVDATVRKFLAGLPEKKIKGEVDLAGVRKLFQHKYPGKKISVTHPSTMPQSGESVFMVQVEGRPLLAVKVYHYKPDTITRELAGIELAKDSELPGFAVSKVKETFAWNNGEKRLPVLVMEASGKRDLRAATQELFTKGSKKLQRETEAHMAKIGEGIAGFHKKFSRPRLPNENEGSYTKYEVKKAGAFLEDFKANTEFQDSGWISAEEQEFLTNALQKQISIYADEGVLHPTIVHADFHLGNIVCGKECTVIDWQNSTMSYRNEQTLANVDPVSDLVRFVDTLDFEAAYARAPEKAEKLKDLFLQSYYAASGISREELQNAMAFHSARYELMQVTKDSKMLKNKQCYVLDLMLRRVGIRAGGVKNPCPNI